MEEEKLVIHPRKYRGQTAVVSARLPKDMIEEIDQVSLNTGYNRNEVIQLCLEFSLDHMETDGEAHAK